MEIQRLDAESAVVLTVSGKLLGGQGADDLEREVGELLAGGQRRIILDLGGVPWADSVGLGVLIAARSAVLGQGGALRLCNLSNQIEGTLTITGLDRIFDVHADVAAALAAGEGKPRG